MKEQATELEIRAMILNQIEPFCIQDLYNRIEKEKTADHGLILKALDEFYDCDLISYERLPEKSGNTEYAFVVRNEIKKKKVKTLINNKHY